MEAQEVAIAAHLLRTPGLGPKTFTLLLQHCASWEALLHAPLKDLQNSGAPLHKIALLEKTRRLFHAASEKEQLLRFGINGVSISEPDYPPLLRHISDPPPILFYTGTLSFSAAPLLAVVGTRNPTPYGKEVTQSLIPKLVESGMGIVSGLALGIDSCAHDWTLKANGYALAVLAAGHDAIVPSSSRSLAKRIVESGGVLVSELPTKTKPGKGLFPRRNRLVAGISAGTLVIEAAMASGSLITARHALEANRDVFAVPGSIFSPYSQGTHTLIQEGAMLVKDVHDITQTLTPQIVSQMPAMPPRLSEAETHIWQAIGEAQTHIEHIVERCPMEPHETTTLVSLMELKGCIRDVGGKWYRRIL